MSWPGSTLEAGGRGDGFEALMVRQPSCADPWPHRPCRRWRGAGPAMTLHAPAPCHEPHRRPFAALKQRGPRRADPVPGGLGPGRCHLDGAAARHARGGRRPDRDRHAVHRPDGGRPDHPGRRQARAEGGGEGGARAGDGARFPPRGRRHAGHPDGLPEPDPVVRPGAFLRRCRGVRRGRADRRRSADRGSRHAGAVRHRAAAWT